MNRGMRHFRLYSLKGSAHLISCGTQFLSASLGVCEWRWVETLPLVVALVNHVDAVLHHAVALLHPSIALLHHVVALVNHRRIEMSQDTKLQQDKTLLRLCNVSYEWLGEQVGANRSSVFRWKQNGIPHHLFLFLVAFRNLPRQDQEEWDDVYEETRKEYQRKTIKNGSK